MSEFIDNDNIKEVESDDLVEEFEQLILSVTKEIIDNTVMDDLKVLKEELTNEMGNFTQFVAKINTLTSNMDNILSETTQNLSSVINTKTTDMDNMLSKSSEVMKDTFGNITTDMNEMVNNTNDTINNTFDRISGDMDNMLTGTTDTMNTKFTAITGDINSLLNETSDMMNNRFKTITSDLHKLLNETTENINGVVSHTTENVDHLINTSTKDIKGAVSSITGSMKDILDINTNNMSNILSTTTDKMDELMNSTTETFSDEINEIKRFISDSEKLIKSNQNILSGVQRKVETKLEEATREIELGTASTRESVNGAVITIELQVEKMVKESKALVELHNIINIKVDSAINKIKNNTSKIDECIELIKDDSKSVKRFKTMMIMNSATLLSVIITLIFVLLRG